LRNAARIASRDGSSAGSMSPARERRLSRPRGASGSAGTVRNAGVAGAGVARGTGLLRETGALVDVGLRDLGGFFDKCLLEK